MSNTWISRCLDGVILTVPHACALVGMHAYTITPVRIRHSSHVFVTQSSHSVDRAGWQAKMAAIGFWIP